MKTTTVSATYARNNFFELLNLVAQGSEIVIERDSKEIATITPKKTTDWEGLKKAMDAAHGIMKDFKLSDSPLRGPKARKFLGKWDKGLKIAPAK